MDNSKKLQKVLADLGLGSRREIETWITEGKVKVNGRQAQIGQRVTDSDKLAVNGRMVKRNRGQQNHIQVLAYHKKEGEVSTRKDPERRSTVYESLPKIFGGRWIAVGRLDINTSGLLLFTNSGELANKLMHPSSGIEREYSVRVQGELTADKKEALLTGVELEDGLARFNAIRESGGEGSNTWWHVTISEGRNREVRRLFEAVELRVSRLIRIKYGPIVLDRRIRRGKYVELDPKSVESLCKSLDVEYLRPVMNKGQKGSRGNQNNRNIRNTRGSTSRARSFNKSSSRKG